jgi:hypothetical protein
LAPDLAGDDVAEQLPTGAVEFHQYHFALLRDPEPGARKRRHIRRMKRALLRRSNYD